VDYQNLFTSLSLFTDLSIGSLGVVGAGFLGKTCADASLKFKEKRIRNKMERQISDLEENIKHVNNKEMASLLSKKLEEKKIALILNNLGIENFSDKINKIQYVKTDSPIKDPEFYTKCEMTGDYVIINKSGKCHLVDGCIMDQITTDHFEDEPLFFVY
jgi:hypothetical protein